MNRAMVSLFENVGVSFEVVWLILVVGFCAICGVKDMRIGLILNVFLSGGSILIMYYNNLDYTLFIYSLVLSGILLAFTISEKTQRVGDFS